MVRHARRGPGRVSRHARASLDDVWRFAKSSHETELHDESIVFFFFVRPRPLADTREPLGRSSRGRQDSRPTTNRTWRTTSKTGISPHLVVWRRLARQSLVVVRIRFYFLFIYHYCFFILKCDYFTVDRFSSERRVRTTELIESRCENNLPVHASREDRDGFARELNQHFQSYRRFQSLIWKRVDNKSWTTSNTTTDV